MIDFTKAKLVEISRRAMLRDIALGAGCAGITATLCRISSAAAQAKATQKVVAYQPQPHGAQQCDNCRQFIAPSSCKVVQGEVSPTGWCKVYVKMPQPAAT